MSKKAGIWLTSVALLVSGGWSGPRSGVSLTCPKQAGVADDGPRVKVSPFADINNDGFRRPVRLE